MPPAYRVLLSLLDTAHPSSSEASRGLPAEQQKDVERFGGYLPQHLFQSLPVHRPIWKTRSSSFGSSVADLDTSAPQLDHRFGPISLDWVDRPLGLISPFDHGKASVPSTQRYGSMEGSPPIAGGSSYAYAVRGQSPTATLPAPSRAVPSSASSARPEAPTPVARFIGEGIASGSTDVAYGVVHLFRDHTEESTWSQTEDTSTDRPIKDGEQDEEYATPESDGTIMGVLAVPSYMTAADFLAFVAPAAEAISHLRMIRDSQPNRCMVLMKFRDERDAVEFYRMFNGKPFNAMGAEICHVVRVTAVSVRSTSKAAFSFPLLANSDPWPVVASPSRPPTPTSSLAHSSSRPSSASAALNPASAAGGVSSKPRSIPLLYELPTCPVCLERMDANITGLMTILCQHTFHCECLSKWGEGRCPVCRYSQTRRKPGEAAASAGGARTLSSVDRLEANDDSPPSSTCASCQTTENLWICLVCGKIGCGRYGSAHAYEHYERSSHLYSMELETGRVWDYAGDGYVHRLIQNKADGKLVELPSASTSSLSGRDSPHPGSSDAVAPEKLEAIGLEYSYLLTSQLESQRDFYEEKVKTLQAKLEDVQSQFERGRSTVETSAQEEEARKARLEELEKEVVPSLEREQGKAARRAEKALSLARTLEKELATERSVSKGLMERLEKVRRESEMTESELGKVRGEVEELREQVRDLMFFVEARAKVDQEGGEAQGGDLEIQGGVSRAGEREQEAPGDGSGGGKKKKKKNKKK